MKVYPPYPSLSRGPRGSFEWAMDQLRAGNDVRREGWPIEIRCDPPRHGGTRTIIWTAVWHLYPTSEFSICKGFSSGVVGADNDSWGDLGVDSAGYTPTTDDIVALDWQTVEEVTPEQVQELDANRVMRYPNEYLARYEASAEAQDRKLQIIACCTLAAGIAMILWAVLS